MQDQNEQSKIVEWLSTILDKVNPFTSKIARKIRETTGVWFSHIRFGHSAFKLTSKQDCIDAYKSNAYVFQVIDKQATAVSSMPLHFVNEKNEPVVNTLEEDLWNQPNPDQKHKPFVYQIISDLLATGESMVYGLKPMGFSKYAEFHVMPSSKTIYTCDAAGNIISYSTELFGKSYTIVDTSTVLHLRLASIDGANKCFSKLSVLGPTIQASSSIFDTEAFIFQNRGASKILTNDSDMPMLDNEREEITNRFKSATAGVDKSGSVYVTNAKLRAIDLLQSPADLKLDESSVAKLRVIAGTFGLDSKIFGDPASSTYNNMHEAIVAAYSQVFIPLCQDYIVDAFNRWWLKDNWQSKLRLSIMLDRIEEIKESQKEFADADSVRMQAVSAALQMPIPSEGKIVMLQRLGFNLAEADAVLNAGPARNETLERIRSLPPAMSSKIIDRLTDDELRQILGL